MKTLYQIEQEYLNIAAVLEEDELTPELESQLSITREELSDKSHNYIQVISSQESWESQIDAEIKRLQDLKKKSKKVQDKLKEKLKDAVVLFGEIKAGTYTLKLRKSELVSIEDENKIPSEFIKVKTEVMKSEVKKALKEGKEIPGACIVQNQNLVIK